MRNEGTAPPLLLREADWRGRGDERSGGGVDCKGWTESYSLWPKLGILFRVNARYLRSRTLGVRERFSRRDKQRLESYRAATVANAPLCARSAMRDTRSVWGLARIRDRDDPARA